MSLPLVIDQILQSQGTGSNAADPAPTLEPDADIDVNSPPTRQPGLALNPPSLHAAALVPYATRKLELGATTMAANYWDSSQRKHWTFTKDQLANMRQKLEDEDPALVQSFGLPQLRHLNIFFNQREQSFFCLCGAR